MGTTTYAYDNENRLTASGGTAFTYDKDGNLMSEKSLQKTAMYEYNGLNRMKTSIVTDNSENKRTITHYAYDAFGRRTLVGDEGEPVMRTLYDGLSFDIIRENTTFTDGSFSSAYESGFRQTGALSPDAGRYRWIGESVSDRGNRHSDTGPNRFTGQKVPLSANGAILAYATGESGSPEGRGAGGSFYFGTDLMGSVRSVTDENGIVAGMFAYDAFGQPSTGNLTSGLNAGYMGKPYDPVTGMYNYGYRDYSPATARFTSVDPVRDGANWFAYAGNDPVNYRDEWGLRVSDRNSSADALRMETMAPDVIRGNQLKTVQDLTRNAEMYQPGAGGNYNLPAVNKTWCNQSTFDVAEATGFNTAAIYGNENRFNVNANEGARNLEAAAKKGTVTQVNAAVAQDLGNLGYTVVVAQERAGIGHLSTVRPTTTSFDNDDGPILSNVGKQVGVMPTSLGFGSIPTTNGNVKYYYDPNQTFDYNTTNVAKEK